MESALIRPVIHLLLHVLLPFLVARRFSPEGYWRPFLLMMLGWAIDLDHLLATPIYQPDRCGIGFHPLHGVWMFALSLGLSAYPRTRWLGLGVLLHLLLDLSDCACLWLSLR